MARRGALPTAGRLGDRNQREVGMANAGQLDRHRVTITCPKCGNEMTRTRKQLRSDAGLHCQQCGADLAKQVAEKSEPIEASNGR